MAAPHPLAVLVVTDRRDEADSLAELLALCGHATRAARTPLDAVAALCDRPPDAVLLDLGLPDGYALAARVRALRPRPLLVALTCYPSVRVKGLLEGIEYLVKPIDPGGLIDRLAGYAERPAEADPPAGGRSGTRRCASGAGREVRKREDRPNSPGASPIHAR